MAVGAEESDTSAPAHSYTTAVFCVCSSCRMIFMYRPFCSGEVRHTCRNHETASHQVNRRVDGLCRALPPG